MLNVKVKGLFNVLDVCVGVNGSELETVIQVEYHDLASEAQALICKILDKHLANMSAGELIRKLGGN